MRTIVIGCHRNFKTYFATLSAKQVRQNSNNYIFLRAMLAIKTSVMQVAKNVLDKPIIPIGLQSYQLSDNGTQWAVNHFFSICWYLGFKHFTMFAYLSRTNGQIYRKRQTFFTRIPQNIADHQPNCHIFVQTIMFACNTQADRATNTIPLGLISSSLPPGPSLHPADFESLCLSHPNAW